MPPRVLPTTKSVRRKVPGDDMPLPDEPVDEYALPPEDFGPGGPARCGRRRPEPSRRPVGLDLDTVQTVSRTSVTPVRNGRRPSNRYCRRPSCTICRTGRWCSRTRTEVLVQRFGAPHAVAVMREALSEVFAPNSKSGKIATGAWLRSGG